MDYFKQMTSATILKLLYLVQKTHRVRIDKSTFQLDRFDTGWRDSTVWRHVTLSADVLLRDPRDGRRPDTFAISAVAGGSTSRVQVQISVVGFPKRISVKQRARAPTGVADASDGRIRRRRGRQRLLPPLPLPLLLLLLLLPLLMRAWEPVLR